MTASTYVHAPTSVAAPMLPAPSGPLSDALVGYLAGGLTRTLPSSISSDPMSRDLHTALGICYELHYRGFADAVGAVDDEWDHEWDPEVLRFRGALERVFLSYVRDSVEYGDDVVAEMDMLALEPTSGSGPSWFLRDEGSWDQMREYFAHRSIYHLKEADPHAWAIPRLHGQAKASFVAVEFDEYGGGRGARVHQELWADLMRAADLNDAYLHYFEAVPAETLAWANLMSLFGLHRSLRGATVGHFAATEITSSPGSRRLVTGLQRLGAPEPCAAFYAEHVEADAVHEQILRHEVVGDLLNHEPHLAADVVFGMRALDLVEEALGARLMTAWKQGESALTGPGIGGTR